MKVSEFATVVTGGTPKTSQSEYWSGDIQWMSSGEVNEGRVYSTKKRITRLGLENSNAQILPVDSVMIALAGQGKTRGMTAILKTETTCNQSLAAILPSPSFDSEYLYLSLSSRYKEIRAMSGSEGRSGLNLKMIKSIEVVLPDLGTQKKIVTKIKALENAISLTDQLLTQTELLKKGFISQLLARKSKLFTHNPYDTKWRAVQLGDILEYEQPTKYIVDGTNYHSSNQLPVLTAGKTFVLGYTDEKEGVFEEGLPVIIFDDFTTDMKYVDFPFKIKSSAMKILKGKQKGNNIKLIYELMKGLSFSPANHKRHWISEYQNLFIELPDPDEQERIAEIIDQFDKQALVNKRLKDKQIELKRGLTKELLGGRIRV